MEDEGTMLIEGFVAMRENGPVSEELPARSHGGDRYELLASPGLALNLARGDIVEITSATAPPTVVRRGGNFCIQIYAEEIAPAHIGELEQNVGEMLSGTIDSMYRGNLALTVPATAGMHNICAVFDEFAARTGIEWYFANVYKNFDDPEDETLLDWWQLNYVRWRSLQTPLPRPRSTIFSLSAAADGALRALLEMLNDSDAHLDDADRQAIAASLIPFAKVLDDAMFVRRHTRWS